MKKYLITLVALACGIFAQAKDYNVLEYGAKGDGRTLDHHAINTAIDSCVAHGGGRVVLPAGTYLCGSTRMKSHVELHLMAGSKILAAPASMKAYDKAEVFEGTAYQDGGHTYFKITTGCRNRGPKERITNIKADVQKGSKLIIKK